MLRLAMLAQLCFAGLGFDTRLHQCTVTHRGLFVDSLQAQLLQEQWERTQSGHSEPLGITQA